CTQLISPIDGSTQVANDTDIHWDLVEEALGYRISIGTTPMGTEIVNNLDLGDETSYSHTSNFPEGTAIYVRVTPYNEVGEATACLEEQFTTETLLKTPACTQLISPIDGSTQVANDTDIHWDLVEEAEGYRISIGKTRRATDMIDNLDLGDVTSYSHTSNFPEGTAIYVRVTPYNQAGEATACLEEQFSTETLLKTPACTQLISPIDGSTQVAIDTDIQWDLVEEAEGYRISIGDRKSGVEGKSNVDVGDETSYSHTSNFPEGTAIYVRVTPYNQAGEATACLEEQFTTETLLKTPACTQLISPIDGSTQVANDTDIHWDLVEEAQGYRISIVTTAMGCEIVKRLDLGDESYYLHRYNIPEGTAIHVRGTSDIQAGEATACLEEQFTTETLLKTPACTQLISPIDGSTQVAIDTDIHWDLVEEAEGYRISIGTSIGEGGISASLDLGDVTSYSHISTFT